MIKKIFLKVLLVLIVIGLIFLGWYLYTQTADDLSKVRDDIDTTISKLEEKINTPGPLVSEQDVTAQPLTVKGIIEQTNIERTKRGLKPLTENNLLNGSARVKALDMFKNQYFAHDSPSGVGVGDLVSKQGYQYLMVGENLALGNFEGDQGVVEAWMDSPGHRANILKNSYQQIGIGVVEDIYQGQKVWMAVQHFAIPSSACSAPDQNLKDQIKINNQKLSQLEVQLKELEKEMDNAQTKAQYEQARQEYNRTVEEYNNLVNQTKLLRDEYNTQVNNYNSCLNSFK